MLDEYYYIMLCLRSHKRYLLMLVDMEGGTDEMHEACIYLSLTKAAWGEDSIKVCAVLLTWARSKIIANKLYYSCWMNIIM